MAESAIWHLVLVTRIGLRIYIQFETIDVFISDKEVEEVTANTDLIINQRFTKRWRIAEIMNFPDE